MNYSQLEKSKILAEYLNIDFDKLTFNEKLYWCNKWDNLMKIAIRLKEDTEHNYPFSFTQHELSFEKEIIFENCFDFVMMINSYNE